VENPGDVVAGGAFGDPELGGDLAVGEAPGDEGRYLLLAAGELDYGSPAGGSSGTGAAGGSSSCLERAYSAA
jgi:hypothetical protein